MGKVAQFFISPLALIIRAEICTIVAFFLSIITLCAGRWPGPIEALAILVVDTSSLVDITNPDALAVNDWYDAHYLSVCSGMWNQHVASMGKNHSTTVCWLQSNGYTFSIAKFIGSKDAQQVILDHPRPLKTKVPFILLVLSIVSMGIAILAFLHGIIMMVRHNKKVKGVKQEIPLAVLRVALFACIASIVFKMISSATITVSASKSSGRFDIDSGRDVHAWTHSGFLAVTWVSVAVMWLALVLVVAAAFRIAATLKEQESEVAGAEGRWDRL